MKKSMYLALGTVFTISLLATGLASAAPKPGASRSVPLGNDVSWPQCGKTLPSDHAFGIVGVNGGLATTTNPCLAEQLLWAARATGLTSQPKIQLYVNTANPGEVLEQYGVTSWPTSNTDPAGNTAPNPYGECTTTAGAYNGYTNDLACSWQYGWNRAVEDIPRFTAAAQAAGIDSAPAAYVWWLDVETENSWQTSSTDYKAKNAATLEGMTAYSQSVGIKVGLYSTGTQWSQIVGTNIGKTGNLAGLDNWRAGARNLSGAKSNCKLAPLTPGGKVTLTQYVSGGLDYDYSCVN